MKTRLRENHGMRRLHVFPRCRLTLKEAVFAICVMFANSIKFKQHDYRDKNDKRVIKIVTKRSEVRRFL